MIQLYQNINTIKVLSRLIEDPYEGFYLREIARNLEMSPMTVKRCLDILVKDDLVVKYAEKNHTLFRANLDDMTLRYLKISYNLAKVKERGIVQRLIQENEGIISIVLYGSYASGKNDRKSDIDLLVISSTRKRIARDTLGIHEPEISIVQMRPDEWEKQSMTNRAFYLEVISDGITLHGKRLVAL
ncbi:MAG: nucleotidyltransferase domain-containing protein [Candidatus Thermoplasmatota archaeon]|nr:nucleotidyltransferase domain-containing protein [Candidatus Thermoplasmatota archaeon]